MKRNSDSLPYVGITSKNRLKIRIGAHKRSERFAGIGFSTEILDESSDRTYIEKREEYWIEKYDSFHNGLNCTKEGKGYSNSALFTTNGFKFSEESKAKMSKAAKSEKRSEHMRKICSEMWADPEKRKHHSEVRKGKRLRRPKLTDLKVEEIRKHFNTIKDLLQPEVNKINEERHKKNSSWKKTNCEILFAQKFYQQYGVTSTCIALIVKNKTRTESLPSICSLKS